MVVGGLKVEFLALSIGVFREYSGIVLLYHWYFSSPATDEAVTDNSAVSPAITLTSERSEDIVGGSALTANTQAALNPPSFVVAVIVVAPP